MSEFLKKLPEIHKKYDLNPREQELLFFMALNAAHQFLNHFGTPHPSDPRARTFLPPLSYLAKQIAASRDHPEVRQYLEEKFSPRTEQYLEEAMK